MFALCFFLGPDIPEVTLRSTQKDPEGREICQLKQYLPGAYEGPVVQNVTKLIKVYWLDRTTVNCDKRWVKLHQSHLESS